MTTCNRSSSTRCIARLATRPLSAYMVFPRSAVAGVSRSGMGSVVFPRASHTHERCRLSPVNGNSKRALRVVMVRTFSSTLSNPRSPWNLTSIALRAAPQAYSQKRPAGGRGKSDKEGGAGAGAGGRSSDASGGSGGNGRLDAPAAARPRGMSDASYMRGASDGGGSNARGFARGVAASASSNSEY